MIGRNHLGVIFELLLRGFDLVHNFFLFNCELVSFRSSSFISFINSGIRDSFEIVAVVLDSADELKPFKSGKAQDQIRKGHVQMKQEYTLDSYNQQLVKHNKLYSTLVSEFIANQEMIIQHMHNLPNHDIIKNLTGMATNINSRFGLLETQFTKYDTDVKNYRDYLKGITDARVDKRYEGGASEGNQFAIEQKEIMD